MVIKTLIKGGLTEEIRGAQGATRWEQSMSSRRPKRNRSRSFREGRKWRRRCIPERVSTARITKHLETVPKGLPSEREQSCTDVTAGQ